MVDFVYRALDFAREFLPLVDAERAAADGQRHFDFGAVELGAKALARLLVGHRGGFDFLFELLQFLVQQDDIGELFGGIGPRLQVGGSALFDIAQIGNVFQLDNAFAELLGNFEDYALYQGGTANGLLHPQLTAFHAAGQVDFTLAG